MTSFVCHAFAGIARPQRRGCSRSGSVTWGSTFHASPTSRDRRGVGSRLVRSAKPGARRSCAVDFPGQSPGEGSTSGTASSPFAGPTVPLTRSAHRMCGTSRVATPGLPVAIPNVRPISVDFHVADWAQPARLGSAGDGWARYLSDLVEPARRRRPCALWPCGERPVNAIRSSCYRGVTPPQPGTHNPDGCGSSAGTT
jgi:hypothetical protein